MTELNDANPRFDFGVGEDASVITLADAEHRTSICSLTERIAASARGDVVLIPLPEDGGISGRIVIGQLTDDEVDGWVAKATRFLRLDSGQFVVDAGGFLGSEPPPGTTEAGDFLLVGVPPGSYHITVYVMIASSIATDLLRRRKTSYLDWYRKSSSGTSLPRWVVELAEERDNELEDDRLDELSEENIDDDASDDFVEVLIQLNASNGIAEPTSLVKNGGPKWERRLPKAFPHPPLSTSASRLRGCLPIARAFAAAFANEDFERASRFCVSEIRDEVCGFLTQQYGQISGKTTISHRVAREEKRRSVEEWKLLHNDPNAVCHSMSFLRWPFMGTQAVMLIADSKHDPDTYVRFEFAFVTASDGLMVAGLLLNWNVSTKRRRRRNRD